MIDAFFGRATGRDLNRKHSLHLCLVSTRMVFVDRKADRSAPGDFAHPCLASHGEVDLVATTLIPWSWHRGELSVRPCYQFIVVTILYVGNEARPGGYRPVLVKDQ
jgi:hypothetical protein